MKSQRKRSLANICPLFKKSDRSLACNYRPVSLTCVPCKLLEHIVCSNIMAHLDEYKLLSARQHAFRKGHSCETQLTTVINDWAKILDNRGQVDTFIPCKNKTQLCVKAAEKPAFPQLFCVFLRKLQKSCIFLDLRKTCVFCKTAAEKVRLFL